MLKCTESEYNELTIRDYVDLACDYCGKNFSRIKKSRQRLNKIVNKDSCGEKECKSKKKKESSLAQYGVEYYFQSEDFKEKQSQTNVAKYGCSVYCQSVDFSEKRQETLIDKYGVDSPLKNKDIQKKQLETCKKLYHVDNYSKTEEFHKKRNSTCLEKYGHNSAIQNEDVKNKKKKTCIKKYGVDNYTKTNEFLNKKKSSCLKKYGVDHTSKLSNNRDLAKKTCIERYGVDNYSKTKEAKTKYRNTCLEKYGVPNPLCLTSSQIYGKTEEQISNWLKEISNQQFKSNYTILEGKEIDLYNEELKLAIEYCGLYWHNEFSPEPRDKKYHYNKFIQCKKKGIRLITIFEDEWLNREKQCKNFLRSLVAQPELKIFARKCQIQEVDRKTTKQFNELNHIQGNSRINQFHVGLFYKNDLIGLTTLSKHHRGSKDSIVLSRMCFLDGVQIIGGSSKMLKACKQWAKDNNYQQIVSWSDNRWSWGNVYEQSGFELDAELKPDYSYVNIKNPKERLSKQSQKKSNTSCPDNLSGHEWAVERGLARIWDCGKIRWKINL